jgi:small multidrug resistance family-3 protein
MPQFSEIVSSPIGAFAVLALAAYREVQGDACFQSGLHHSSGTKQIGWFFAWTAVLVCTACS